ncbi:MAG: hypothetical protein JWP25_3575 [Bradyrhizobium sp.]|nr:hypothetical protein [Bradyrhizobium sp.]
MTHFLLTHQPHLIALAWINGAAVVAVVIGVSYRPRRDLEKVTGVSS